MLIETENYRGLTIELHYDDQISFDDGFGNEPVVIISTGNRRGVDVALDQSKFINITSGWISEQVLIAVRDKDVEALANELGMDFRRTAKSWVIDNYNYFKSENAAFNFMLRAIFDSEICVESYDTQDSTWFMLWDQKELNHYTGMKNAKPPMETLRHIVNGEVYGFIIQETGESCWGFIGDSDDCMNEARGIADDTAEKRDTRAAREWEESRPDMYGFNK